MAKFNFENYEQTHQSNNSGNGDFKVKFFKLKNGETQVLRFPYKAASEFDTVDVHTIQEGTNYRKISCLRNSYEPVEKCPLCAANKPLRTRFLAKVLYYEPDQAGNMAPKAGVWDAPITVAKDLRSFINEYGDISNMIFKVTRIGDKIDTKYTIIPANTAIYKEEIYPADFKDFEGLKMENRFYFDKTAEEMNIYLSTGQFPPKVKANQNQGFVQQTPVQQVPTNQTFTPQSMQSPNYIDEGVQAGAQTFNSYVPPVNPGYPTFNQAVSQPAAQQFTPEPVVQPTINVAHTPISGGITSNTPVTGKRYSY